jgi:hypothetical protein
VLELVADEPELVGRLEIVAGNRVDVRRRRVGEEARAEMLDRRPRRRNPGGEGEA